MLTGNAKKMIYHLIKHMHNCNYVYNIDLTEVLTKDPILAEDPTEVLYREVLTADPTEVLAEDIKTMNISIT